MLGLLFTASVAASAVLAETHTLTGLIPYILGFSALMLVIVFVGVFMVMITDPSKLMLGQISGSEYVAIRRLRGDSVTGELRDVLLIEAAKSGNQPLEPGPERAE